MEKMMALALAQARLAAAEGEIPVGAVLVRGDQVLAQAHNRREATHDPTGHAEIQCLRDWRLRECTLYVTLEPCPMCAGAMLMAQLGQCVYGAADPRLGCCGSVYDLPDDPALGGRTQWVAGVCAEECAALLQNFLREKRTEVRHG